MMSRTSHGMRVLLIAAAANVFGASSGRAASPCLHYGREAVALTGRVVARTFYGPPGYGEAPSTDSREKQAILVLAAPLCVEANVDTGEQGESNQREVTLVCSAGFRPSQHLGRVVTIEGTLFHAFTGHHQTPVLMATVGTRHGKE